METQPHPHHRAHIAIGVLASAFASAIAFEYFFFGQMYGVALAVFLLLLLAGVHVLTTLAGGRGNLWAYLFLVPFVLSLAATVTYSSDPARFFAFVVSVASLAFFTFWFTAPRVRYDDVSSLWPFSLFLESFIPFSRLGAFGRELVKDRGRVSKILVGAGIAVPFLILFGLLFASADGVIRQTFMNLFTDQKQFWLFMNHAAWDVFAFLFFAAAGYTVVTRIMERRMPKAVGAPEPFDAVVVNTFLVLLDLLFLGFIAVQFFTLFGGEAVIRSQNVTYAAYAREGFFQLLAVAAAVLAITSVLYRYTGLTHWLTRILAGGFMVQTGLIIASAIRRLALYVDAYGLTLQRYWAFVAIALIAVALLAILVAMFMNLAHHRLFHTLFIAGLSVFSCTLLLNAEASIARVNIQRFLSGGTAEFDASYLTQTLSSDAVPVIADAYRALNALPGGERSAMTERAIGTLRMDLVNARNELRETVKNWKRATVSDHRALSVLERDFSGQ